ncbi:MAG: hypothetical protein RBR87_12375 [Bacteroidales bacterium]|jgi:hypothetical protein|nr:hypothetical protein [Bacteroidales bacterium]
MKNKKVYNLFACAIFAMHLSAQVVNVNPDPNGEPFIGGDGIITPPEIEATVPFMALRPESAAAELPTVVDNSQLIYMPPVFNQRNSGSCVQVAELWYSFGYEVNRLRGVQAGNGIDDLTNLYHPFYSYNFLNGGNGQSETFYKSGFMILKDNGCPSYEVYVDPAIDWSNPSKYLYWMNSYNNYLSGMQNKISGYENITWGNSYESIGLLKHWIADHNLGEDNGGLAIISVYVNGWTIHNTFPPGTSEAGKHYVSQWGSSGGHALTIVGYNDEVECFDINGDGVFTNEDFDNNGVIELSECEKGAFKVVNSWNPNTFGDAGYIYIPYKLMASGLQINKRAYICHVQNAQEPSLTIKASVEYPERNKLGFKVGYAQNANQTEPINSTFYKSFKYQGGANQMRGAYSGPIEVGLDFGHWYQNEDVGKIFFIVDENENGIPTNGLIKNFSIIDHRWGEEFELACAEIDVPIANNTQTTLSVDYDLLVPGDNSPY